MWLSAGDTAEGLRQTPLHLNHGECVSFLALLAKGSTQKKITGLFGNFSQHRGGGGLLNSQNFCKFTKSFLVCQNHSEVLKHVLQWGGGDI